jgi:hypothetical protein
MGVVKLLTPHVDRSLTALLANNGARMLYVDIDLIQVRCMLDIQGAC